MRALRNMEKAYLAEVKNVNTIEIMDVKFLSYVRGDHIGHLSNVFTDILFDRAENG